MKRLFKFAHPSAESPLTRWDVAVIVFQILGMVLALAGTLVGIIAKLS